MGFFPTVFFIGGGIRWIQQESPTDREELRNQVPAPPTLINPIGPTRLGQNALRGGSTAQDLPLCSSAAVG